VVRRPFAFVPITIADGFLGGPFVIAPPDVGVIRGLLRECLAHVDVRSPRRG
jgi:hypothetical protein